jgi:hypothetical protein
MRKLLAVLVVFMLVFGLGGTAAAAEPVIVYFVNAIPDTVLDVYVNTHLFIEDLSAGEVVGPFVGELKSMVRIDMIPANTVLDPSSFTHMRIESLLPPNQPLGFIAMLQGPNQPTLSSFFYAAHKTGQGQASFHVVHAMLADGLEVLLSPGTANEQRGYYFFNDGGFWTRVPAGPTTASLVLFDSPPSDDPVLGPFTVDLKPGRHYVIILYGTLDNIRVIRQEFNPGE